jgi:probable HAF family extracellular repeat protein
MVGMGDLAGGDFESYAAGVSADGLVVVGLSSSAAGPEGFRWTAAGGLAGLGDLPGGSVGSNATGVSADGSVVVGQSSSDLGFEAFRWTAGGGMVGLGDLPGGPFLSEAIAVSGDGSVVVGGGTSAAGTEVFRWTAADGMRSLRDVLVTDYGLGSQLAGWSLQEARGLSADGRVIVGYGVNPHGLTEAWVARLDGPPTMAEVQVGDGDQRSMVRSLTVTFSGPVTFANNDAAAAFSLTRQNLGGGAVNLAAEVATDTQGRTVVTLRFTGGAVDLASNGGQGSGLSLADGRYRLDILDGYVTGAGGALDGDGNGIAGGAYQSADEAAGPGQLRLYRLFGDATGNGVVDLLDLQALRGTFNASAPDPLYLDYLDADDNDTVDLVDLQAFRGRFNGGVFP